MGIGSDWIGWAPYIGFKFLVLVWQFGTRVCHPSGCKLSIAGKLLSTWPKCGAVAGKSFIYKARRQQPTTAICPYVSASVRIELDMEHLFGSRRPLATIAAIDLIFANRFHINHIPLAWFMHELRSQVTLRLFPAISCCLFLILC